MAYRSTQDAMRDLVAVAATQGGYVTAQQADRAGYASNHLAYHVSAGNIDRVARGLYRLPHLPASEHDDLIRAVLQCRGRDDVPRAVVSHTSALALHELSDALPPRIHLTVPKGWRRDPPPGCVLHRAELDDEDIESWEGFGVTTPLRTLVDVADDTPISADLVHQAVVDARNRGLVSAARLRRAIDGLPEGPARDRLATAIKG